MQEAEIARKKHDHQTTESLTGPWIEPKAVVREGKVHKRFLVLEKAQKRLGQNYLDEELSNAYFFFLTSVKLGLAGMGRIAHVDANTQIKNDPRRHLPHLATIQNVDDLFIAIDPKSLPPRTIHFDPISWIGERSQDSAKTMELMNQPNLAVQEIQAAIWRLNTHIEQVESTVFKNRLPDRSARAALRASLAENDGEAWNMILSLREMREILTTTDNFERMVSLTIKGAKFLTRPGISILERVQLAGEVGLNTLWSLITNSQQTIKEFKTILKAQKQRNHES